MTTNGQIFRKLAEGETLRPDELLQLERAIDGYDRTHNFVGDLQNGAGTIRAGHVNADAAIFGTMPNGFMVMDKQTDTTIPDGTFTTVTNYDDYVPVVGGALATANQFFDLDITNGRIYIKDSGGPFAFYVYTVWSSNSTGNRSARVYQYDAETGTEISFSVVSRVEAVTGGSTTTSNIIVIPWGGERKPGDYCTVKVFQDSGADLTLGQIAFGAFKI